MKMKLFVVLSIVVLAKTYGECQANDAEHGSSVSSHGNETVASKMEHQEIPMILWRSSAGSPRLKRTVETGTHDEKTERPSHAACRKYNEAAPTKINSTYMFEGKPVPAPPGEYPHMGALMFPRDDSNEARYECGSFLISERYVLTVAHCFIGLAKTPTFVRFGVVVWNSTDNDHPPLDVEIENITIHPEYVAYKRPHDIALLRLRKDVEFNALIRPACLYSDKKDIDPETELVVSGWGIKAKGYSRNISYALQIQKVNTVPLQDCNATHIYSSTIQRPRNFLNEGAYCATDIVLENDSCLLQHSGSPLQLVEDEKLTMVVGIVSWGYSCGGPIPLVYSRVAYYLDWIESVVWPSSS